MSSDHDWLSFISICTAAAVKAESEEQTASSVSCDGISTFSERNMKHYLELVAQQRNPSWRQRRRVIYRQAKELHGTLFITSLKNSSGRYRRRRRPQVRTTTHETEDISS